MKQLALYLNFFVIGIWASDKINMPIYSFGTSNLKARITACNALLVNAKRLLDDGLTEQAAVFCKSIIESEFNVGSPLYVPNVWWDYSELFGEYPMFCDLLCKMQKMKKDLSGVLNPDTMQFIQKNMHTMLATKNAQQALQGKTDLKEWYDCATSFMEQFDMSFIADASEKDRLRDNLMIGFLPVFFKDMCIHEHINTVNHRITRLLKDATLFDFNAWSRVDEKARNFFVDLIASKNNYIFDSYENRANFILTLLLSGMKPHELQPDQFEKIIPAVTKLLKAFEAQQLIHSLCRHLKVQDAELIYTLLEKFERSSMKPENAIHEPTFYAIRYFAMSGVRAIFSRLKTIYTNEILEKIVVSYHAIPSIDFKNSEAELAAIIYPYWDTIQHDDFRNRYKHALKYDIDSEAALDQMSNRWNLQLKGFLKVATEYALQRNIEIESTFGMFHSTRPHLIMFLDPTPKRLKNILFDFISYQNHWQICKKAIPATATAPHVPAQHGFFCAHLISAKCGCYILQTILESKSGKTLKKFLNHDQLPKKWCFVERLVAAVVSGKVPGDEIREKGLVLFKTIPILDEYKGNILSSRLNVYRENESFLSTLPVIVQTSLEKRMDVANALNKEIMDNVPVDQQWKILSRVAPYFLPSPNATLSNIFSSTLGLRAVFALTEWGDNQKIKDAMALALMRSFDPILGFEANSSNLALYVECIVPTTAKNTVTQ